MLDRKHHFRLPKMKQGKSANNIITNGISILWTIYCLSISYEYQLTTKLQATVWRKQRLTFSCSGTFSSLFLPQENWLMGNTATPLKYLHRLDTCVLTHTHTHTHIHTHKHMQLPVDKAFKLWIQLKPKTKAIFSRESCCTDPGEAA